MNKIYHFIILFLTLAAGGTLASCTDTDAPYVEQQIVVEGWIDDGGFPMVFLTQTVTPQSDEQGMERLDSLLIRWGRVTITDETAGDSVTLKGGKVDNQALPFGYTSTDMRGRAGHTYRLDVHYQRYHATARTTIPEAVSVDSFRSVRVAGNDTLRELHAYVSGRANGAYGYKFLVQRKNKDTYLKSSYLGVYSNAHLDANPYLTVSVGHSMNTKHFTPLFSVNDTLSIKLASIDEASYNFWNDYESTVTFSRNPFFSSGNNIRSNIVGGLGYWCGYGGEAGRPLIMRDLE